MRSMGRGTTRRVVEGNWHRRLRIQRATADVCAFYPSTRLRLVPLPIFDGRHIALHNC